ncbi:TIR protein [Candidatus Magnetomorum sp. HK-1]|nr:TIR protein [Candidatus Magnetomorum sp. HK-1]
MKIFISYSHEDEKWKNRLEKELRVFELEGNLDIWSDTKIQTGANWLNEIQNAIEQSKIAILLISTTFLISDFIRKKEIPQILLKKERQDDFIVFPIIIEPCNWKKIPWIEDI